MTRTCGVQHESAAGLDGGEGEGDGTDRVGKGLPHGVGRPYFLESQCNILEW